MRRGRPTTVGHGLRFLRGMLAFLRDPITLEEARAQIAQEWQARAERLLGSLDRLVWSHPASPYLPLFRHAGIEAADVADLVRRLGLEPTMEALRDEGVYVSYEEYMGAVPARRGSATFHFRPSDFFNPRIRPDFTTGSSGTRSGGVPVASSWVHRRHGRAHSIFRDHLWGVVDVPTAVWRPVLPAGGTGTVLTRAARGNPPERWFSQIPPRMRGVAFRKRMTTALVPRVARLAGVWVPRPEHVPTSNPEPVLSWCRDALLRSRRALLSAYPSSGVRLAAHALDRGVSLRGLVLSMGGEPVTAAKAAVVRAAGAAPENYYAFSPLGGVGVACPACPDEELHVVEYRTAVVQRLRPRPDGVEVGAFLWTTLAPEANSVLLNVESDDYGELRRDEEPCTCELGAMGFRWRVSYVRGMSKVVAGGVTVRGDVLERLAEVDLPERFGGRTGDFQFVEEERDGEAVLSVRVDPRTGPVDEAAVLAAVRDALRRTEMGLLADAVWSPTNALRVVRAPPVQARSGKTLPFEALKAPARQGADGGG